MVNDACEEEMYWDPCGDDQEIGYIVDDLTENCTIFGVDSDEPQNGNLVSNLYQTKSNLDELDKYKWKIVRSSGKKTRFP